jgi:hypothetical protein
MQSQSTRSLLLAAAAVLCVSAAQAQTTDTQKAPAVRKATAADKLTPTQVVKPGANGKAVAPTSQRLQVTPSAQSTPAPYKDEAGCHSKASDA